MNRGGGKGGSLAVLEVVCGEIFLIDPGPLTSPVPVTASEALPDNRMQDEHPYKHVFSSVEARKGILMNTFTTILLEL
jgi:hypothetical protein